MQTRFDGKGEKGNLREREEDEGWGENKKLAVWVWWIWEDLGGGMNIIKMHR